MKKNKFKKYLPISLVVLVLLLSTAVIGVVSWRKNHPAQDETVTKKMPSLEHMSMDEIDQVEDLLSEMSEEELEKLRAKAGNVQDELTLRLLLLLDEEISIHTTGKLEIIYKMPVKGTKTLTGDMSITMFYGAEVEENFILEVLADAELKIDGLLLDANDVCNAIMVSSGATLHYMSGTIQYCWNGIKNFGTAYVSDGTIKEVKESAVQTNGGAKSYISGGNFLDSDASILVVMGNAVVEVTGGVMDGAYSYPIMNYGTFTMTGGTIKNGKGVNSHAIINFGIATIDGGDDYIEISDCYALFYTMSKNSMLVMNKVYGHDFENYIGHVMEGSIKITNSKLENSGERGILFTNTILGEMENVTIKNTKKYSIHARYPSVVNCKNVTIIDSGHTGYENAGATSTLENVVVKNAAQAAFRNDNSGYNGTNYTGVLTLKNCRATNSKHCVSVAHGTKVVAKNCVFEKTTRTNIYVADGILDFSDVKIYGSKEKNVYAMYMFKGSKATFKNTEVADGVSGLFSDGEFSMTGGSIHGHNTDMSGAGLVVGRNGNATLKDVKIYDNVSKNNGGAIQNNGKLTATGLSIMNNTAMGTVGGGAIHISGNSISTTLTNCIISGNTALKGGAIRNAQPLTITDSVIENNSSEQGSGAIYNYSTLVLNNVAFRNNYSKGNGGAVQTYKDLEINGGSFEGNVSEGSSGGGAIYVDKGCKTTTINNCNFIDNKAANGGAIRHNQTITVNGGEFKGNHATKNGGAIYHLIASTIRNATFSNNTADGNGNDMFLYEYSTAQVENCTFNKETGNVYLQSGGGTRQGKVVLSGKITGLNVLYSSDNLGVKLDEGYDKNSTFILTPDGYQNEIPVIETVNSESKILDDAVKNIEVGGLADCNITVVDKKGYLTMDCVEIVGGERYSSLAKAIEAAQDGDSIKLLSDFTVGEPITISKSIILTSDEGIMIKRASGLSGSMFMVSAGQLSIQGSDGKEIVLDGNTTKAATTRAIDVASGATLNMNYATIQNFNSYHAGAAIYNSGTTTLANVSLLDNTTTKDNAGGTIRNQYGTLTITDAIISGSNGKDGGALYAASGTKTTLTRCEFTGNNSVTRGGAIYYNGNATIDSKPAFSIIDCIFAENTAATNGGAMSVNHATIQSTTFTSNTAPIGKDVYLLNNASNVILSGKLTGLTVTSSAANMAIQIDEGYDVTSDVTVIPTVADEYQVIGNRGVQADEFGGIIDSITLVSDHLEDAWFINQEGCLTRDYCVAVNDQKYYTLKEAVAAAVDGDTITVLRDFTIGTGIKISKSLTLTSNDEVTIFRGTGLTGNMFRVEGGTFTIQGSENKVITIDGNTTGTSSIRAVEVLGGTSFRMDYATIKNFNSYNAGAAIYNSGTTTLTNVSLIDNKTTKDNAGGTIRNQTGTVTITDAIISGSNGKDGGALYAAGGTQTTLTRCEFTGNHSVTRGGAIYYNGNELKGTSPAFIMNECSFAENTAETYGGAMYVKYATINGATFANNTATTAGNDAYLSADSYVTLSGKINGLSVQYSAAGVGVKVGGVIDAKSDITIIPAKYEEGLRVVLATSDVDAEILKSAIALMDVQSDGVTSNVWDIDGEGYLMQDFCAEVNGVQYYSLKDAVNAASNGDTIILLRSFILTSRIQTSKSVTITADKEVTITRGSELTNGMLEFLDGSSSIAGKSDSERIIFDGASSSAITGRALLVSEPATFHMEYVTVKNGNNSANGGAGLYNNGITTLTNVVFDNNKTKNTIAGGAIYHKAGILTMTDCVISNSYGNLGAGLYAANGTKTTLTGCTFTGNSSTTWGGGIDYEGQELYSDGSLAFVVNDCTFTNNSALESGGAMCLKHATINGATFSGNTAKKSGPDVYNGSKSYITILGKLQNMSIAYSGTATATKIGGAIDTQSDITIFPSSYTSGLQVVTKADATVSDAMFETAIECIKSDDETWFINKQGCLEKAIAEVNGVKYNSFVEALDKAVDGDTITLLDGFTINSTIQISKSVMLTANKEVTIKRGSGLTSGMLEFLNGTSSIVGKSASERIIFDGSSSKGISGRALWVSAPATFHMEYVTVKNGNNNNNGGAGLYNKGTTTLTNVIFDNNKTSSSISGGAIRHESGTLTITDSTISNSSGSNGAGIYVAAGTVEITNSVISDNSGRLGAGLHAANGTKTTITGCKFIGNESNYYGGGIDYEGSVSFSDGTPAFVVNNCTFENNYARYSGGAMCLKHATINGATFSGNTADTSGSDVYIGSNSYITILGKLQGMSVTYAATGTTNGVRIGGAIDAQSDITIIPSSYTANAALVTKSSTAISDEVFATAIQRMTVAPNGTVNNWIINSEGKLVQQ